MVLILLGLFKRTRTQTDTSDACHWPHQPPLDNHQTRRHRAEYSIPIPRGQTYWSSTSNHIAEFVKFYLNNATNCHNQTQDSSTCFLLMGIC